MYTLNSEAKNTVLIIDDEMDLTNSLGELISSYGYDIIASPDGDDGLKQLEKNFDQISLILCDISMPKMNGIQFFKKALAKYSFIPVVMLTAHSEIEYTTEVIRLGAIDYLVKPFDPTVLESKLNIWTEIARRRESYSHRHDVEKASRMEALLRIQNTNQNKVKF